jgi:hypothetical protein
MSFTLVVWPWGKGKSNGGSSHKYSPTLFIHTCYLATHGVDRPWAYNMCPLVMKLSSFPLMAWLFPNLAEARRPSMWTWPMQHDSMQEYESWLSSHFRNLKLKALGVLCVVSTCHKSGSHWWVRATHSDNPGETPGWHEAMDKTSVHTIILPTGTHYCKCQLSTWLLDSHRMPEQLKSPAWGTGVK